MTWETADGIDSDERARSTTDRGIVEGNQRFANAPASSDDLHRPVNLASDRLRDILCKREQRYVGTQLTFSFERKRIMLQETEVTLDLVGRYVETYAYAYGRLDVRWKGYSLPYTVFDKDQRVTHAAITENKRLGGYKFHPVLTVDLRLLPGCSLGMYPAKRGRNGMDIQDAIAELAKATKPDRRLDASIAKALGFERVPKTKERDHYWLSRDGKEVNIPRYTFSFDAAYCLATTADPNGGVSWDGATGAARIGRGSSHVAATAPIALCIAILHALDRANGE